MFKRTEAWKIEEIKFLPSGLNDTVHRSNTKKTFCTDRSNADNKDIWRVRTMNGIMH